MRVDLRSLVRVGAQAGWFGRMSEARGVMSNSVAFCYPAYDYRPGRQSRKNLPQNVIGGVALAWVVAACGWTMYTNLAGPRFQARWYASTGADHVEVAAAPHIARMSAAAKVAAAFKAAESRSYAGLFHPSFSLGFQSGTFADNAALKSDRLALAEPVQVEARPQDPLSTPPTIRQLVQSIPIAAPKRSELRGRQTQTPQNGVAPADTPAAIAIATAADKTDDVASVFSEPRHTGPSLAYASPDGGLPSDRQTVGALRGYDRFTAVYDISAHTVYMPDGSKLEAHSGLGELMDSPKHVAIRNRGATPPHVYDLEPREAPFHGVPALRLNPLGGEENVFGRTGLLAHSYMLGPRGDSNGCVSFKNYDAFLQAYRNQQVKRLAVVERLG
jgi:hypothetical protein